MSSLTVKRAGKGICPASPFILGIPGAGITAPVGDSAYVAASAGAGSTQVTYGFISCAAATVVVGNIAPFAVYFYAAGTAAFDLLLGILAQYVHTLQA